MDYTRIVAISGMPGLFEVVSSKSDGAIARSLEDKSTKFISSRVHNLSHLESIEIYTTGENRTLSDIFTAMKSSTEALPDQKDSKALKSYFERVYPELDFERVYASDMKKMVKWFDVLTQNDVDFTAKAETETESEEPETEETETIADAADQAPAQEEAVAAPKAKAKPKATSESEAATSSDEPAPAEKKKAAPKKASKKDQA